MSARKHVTDEVFQRIVSAIKRIGTDPDLRPTKRQIENLTGLSHDAVARAFRQDADSGGKPWGINASLESLAGSTRGKSPTEEQFDTLRREIAEKNQTIRELQDTLDAYATALFAYAVNTDAQRAGPHDPVPIGRNRPREDT